LNKLPTIKPSLLQKEQKYVSQFLLILVIVSLSGFITWLIPTHGIWQQWTYLLHTLVGFFLIILCIPFIVNHVQLAQAFRRPAQASVGWVTLLSFLIVAITGLNIGIIGQYESQQWIYNLHIVSGCIIALLTFTHLFFYRFLISYFANRDKHNRFSSFSKAINKQLGMRVLYSSLVSLIFIGLLSLAYNLRSSTYVDEAAVLYTKPFGEGIFSPSQAVTSSGSFLDARRIGRSEKCGDCHQQITDEWRSSMHARSASDPFFQKNLHSLENKKGIESTRYCGGCHMPVGLLSGELSEGGNLSEGMHITEGISCMGCHGISKAVSLEGVGSYLYEPEHHYLFGDSDGVIQTELHNYLIKINPRQHKKDMARDILADPTHCATCHEQFIDKDMNNWGWVKLQSQYQAWVKGPFSRHSDKSHASDEVYRCQDCHFPLIDSNDPSANNDSKHRSHRTAAANTAVPYLLGDKKQLETVIKFMQDNRLSVMVQLANKNTHQPILAGNKVTINVGVSSDRVGHFFPAGTIDINEPWIEFIVTDATGKQVFASGLIDEKNQVDKEARFYFSSLVNRQGKRVWKHDLFNAVGESYVNLIYPGKADIHSYTLIVPQWAKGPLKAKARLRYRKFNQDYASWALDDDSIRLPIVDMAENEINFNINNIQK
jgi:cytochrome b561